MLAGGKDLEHKYASKATLHRVHAPLPSGVTSAHLIHSLRSYFSVPRMLQENSIISIPLRTSRLPLELAEDHVATVDLTSAPLPFHSLPPYFP